MAAKKNDDTANKANDKLDEDPVSNTAPKETEVQDDRPKLNDKENQEATKEGLKEAVKEKTLIANAEFDDLPGAPPQILYINHDEIQQWAHLLELGVDAFEKRVSVKADKDGSVPDEKVYGLLALERNGQNRTPYVKAMIKRLGLTKDDPLPGGGPDYTHDLTSTSNLYS